MKKAVYVEWDDSSSCGSSGAWAHKRDAVIEKPIRCKTVGFILDETDTHITLISTSDGENHVSGDMTIPKSAIRKRRVVRWK